MAKKAELPEPTLIIGGGVPAVGKSTFFNALAARVYDAFVLDKDETNNAFLSRYNDDGDALEKYFCIAEPFPMASDHYGQHVKYQTFLAMFNNAIRNLGQGKHPIFDAPNVKELNNGYVEEIFERVGSLGYRVKMVYCHADEDAVRERMTVRGAERDLGKLKDEASWRKFMESEPILPDALNLVDHVKIDTGNQIKKGLEQAIHYLKSQ